MSEQTLKYTKEHEWVKVEGNIATVGITTHAQEALGDITFVELPSVGTSFSLGDQTGSIESVKAVSEIYSPLTGDVTEVNEGLSDNPEQVNEDPYNTGWIFKLEIKDVGELGSLLDYDAYQEFLASEG